eukprot:scaffold1060_cov246-Pinguiococcus_pyrenoidosus.AAC.6
MESGISWPLCEGHRRPLCERHRRPLCESHRRFLPCIHLEWKDLRTCIWQEAKDATAAATPRNRQIQVQDDRHISPKHLKRSPPCRCFWLEATMHSQARAEAESGAEASRP